MKNEVRIAANEIAVTALRNAMGDKIVPVRVAKKNGFAFDTGIQDENGKPVYVVFDVTVKATEDNKTGSVKAFDLEAAVQARLDYENAPKKEPKAKKVDPEAEAKRAAHKERERITEEWCMANLTGEGMSASEIRAQIPELEEVTQMQVGTYLKNIAERNLAIQRNVVKGKPLYCLA